MKKVKILTVFFIIITLFGACRKADVSPEKIESTSLETVTNRVSIEQAKAIFYHREVEDEVLDKNSSFLFTKDTDCFGIQPIWELAREVETLNDKGLTIVPIKMPKDLVAHGRGAQLIFYPDESCTTPVELMFYEGYQYDETRPFEIENSSFKGFVSVFNLCDCSSLVFPVDEGEVLSPVAREFVSTDCQSDKSVEERDFWPGWLTDIFSSGGLDCYDFGSSFWGSLGNFFSGIWNSVSGIFSGSGSGYNGSSWQGSWLGFTYTGFPYYNSSGGIGGGGGGTATINNLFESPFFNGEGQLVIGLLNEIVAEYDLEICTEQLHQTLYSCINNNQGSYIVGPPPPPGEAISLNAYVSILSNISSTMPCLSSVISSYSSDIDMEGSDGSLLCYLESQNTFDIEPIDLLQIMKNKCGTDAECHKNLVDCFNRLDVFQNYYDVVLNQIILQQIYSVSYTTVCSLEQEEFDQEVRDKIFEVYPNAQLLVDFIMTTNEDVYNLNQEMTSAPPWLWPIIQEIAAEMIINIIEKQLKLNLSDDIKDLIKAIGQQDLAAFVVEAIDIVATFHPTVRLLDAIWDTTTAAKKAYSLINKVKGMATSLGNDALDKIWIALNSNGRSVLSDLNISDWPLGIRLNNTTVFTFWDDLTSAFGIESADIIHYTTNGFPAQRFNFSGLNIAMYYASSGFWTITINGNEYKFRFD